MDARLRPVALTIVALAMAAGCAPSQPKQAPAKDRGADMSGVPMRYGFRYDPMRFVDNDRTAQGALVRSVVFKRLLPGDEKLIEAEFQKAFAGQKPDGSLPDPHNQGLLASTGAKLLGLMAIGCPPDRPEMKRAVSALRKAAAKLKGDKAADMSCYAVHALCRLGMTDIAAVKPSLRKLADEMDNMLGRGCPWTPEVQLNALWAGRKVADVDAAVVKGLKWIEGGLEPPGCSSTLGLCEPWSMVQMVGVIDHPISRRIARRLVPMLLRSQQRDGSWGGHEYRTFWTMLALKKYGLLEELRELPPLPPDWNVVRSIPAPGKRPFGLAYDGERLWVHDRASWKAVAVSPKTGKVLRSVSLPRKAGMFTIGVGRGALWIAAGGGKADRKLYKIEPATGKLQKEIALDFASHFVQQTAEVEGKILVPDGWEGYVWVVDPDRPKAKPRWTRIASGMPLFMSASNGRLWAADVWARAIVLTNMKGELLDWGEWPFGLTGIAWDGRELWALDGKNKRICAIEKAKPAPAAATRVTRRADRVRIDGLPDIKMTGPWPRLRGMEILLKHRGEETTLKEITVHSGDAFNLCHASRWELRGGLSIPSEPLGNVAGAYGYDFHWTRPGWYWRLSKLPLAERRRISERFLDQLWWQVRAGRPVLLGGTHGKCGSWRAVAGYDRAGKKICYAGGNKPYEWAELIDPKVRKLGFWDSQVRGPVQANFFGGWQANAAFIMGPKMSNPTPRDKALLGLARAVEMFEAPEFQTNSYGGVTYWFGEQAYEHWADELHELDYPADTKKPRPKGADWYDFSNFAGQVKQIAVGRAAAAEFCVKAAAVLPKAKSQLRTAAGAYRQEAAIARKAFPAFLTGKAKERLAWLGDEARREAGAAAIRRLLEKERAAVAAIKSAAQAEGVNLAELVAPPQPRPPGPALTPLAEATKIKAADGGTRPAEWAVLLGDWSVDKAGTIVGQAMEEAYLCRVAEHPDDVRVTCTIRAVEGGEVTLWICGSPSRAEYEAYTLAVSTDGAKLQRRAKDIKRLWDVKIAPGRDYVMTFERRKATLRGFLGRSKKPFVEWTDPNPLRGPGHRTLGFYVWSGKVTVSKIKVERLR